VRLISIADAEARHYYEAEALRGGWSVRQLDRQISTLGYQRAGAPQRAEESGPALEIPEAQIKEPFVLEFLGLKDEYSEAS
jgi:predicted nuclease of restriction endonuclease-like (RecB) superfamily